MSGQYGSYTAAMDALRPVFEAERRRGNSGKWDDGDIHETRPSWVMRFPLDVPALEAEFEFSDRIEVRNRRGGVIDLFGSRGPGAFLVVGGAGGTWWTRRRRAAWWREWEASPRPRIRIENALPPYVN
ncbi:hypothetical protein [Mesorhizobium japonicum]|uniref:hypothetical protein n=1 Tax=Mesorhizobium japonicum TaxID=2066070 RepID=UPI003B59CCDA